MTEKLLNNEISAQVQKVFDQLQQPVHVLYFGRKSDCDYCDQTLQLVQEVVELSDRLSYSAHDVEEDALLAQQYQVEQVPSLVIAGKDGEQLMDYGVRLVGIPAGHEFSTLIHDLVLVSGRDSGLAEPTRQFLAKLDQPVLLQVFTTPTCPYCPQAVVLAHQMALESPLVQAEMVDAMEFPDLADRYNVGGVPQTTINAGAGTLVGAAPEDYLIEEIQRALGKN